MFCNFAMRTASLLLALALLGAAGCTPTPISVDGSLMFDDNKPIPGAGVRFISTTGAPEAVSFTDKDGAFKVDVIAGDYKVVVTKSAAGPTIKGEPGSPEDMAKLMKGFKEKGASTKIVDPVPEVYSQESTTTLKAKVESGKKIELKISRK